MKTTTPATTRAGRGARFNTAPGGLSLAGTAPTRGGEPRERPAQPHWPAPPIQYVPRHANATKNRIQRNLTLSLTAPWARRGPTPAASNVSSAHAPVESTGRTASLRRHVSQTIVSLSVGPSNSSGLRVSESDHIISLCTKTSAKKAVVVGTGEGFGPMGARGVCSTAFGGDSGDGTRRAPRWARVVDGAPHARCCCFFYRPGKDPPTNIPLDPPGHLMASATDLWTRRKLLESRYSTTMFYGLINTLWDMLSKKKKMGHVTILRIFLFLCTQYGNMPKLVPFAKPYLG